MWQRPTKSKFWINCTLVGALSANFFSPLSFSSRIIMFSTYLFSRLVLFTPHEVWREFIREGSGEGVCARFYVACCIDILLIVNIIHVLCNLPKIIIQTA